MGFKGILRLDVVPQSCADCTFSKATVGFCIVIEKPVGMYRTIHGRKSLRHPDCPIEVEDVSGPQVRQTALFGIEEEVVG